MVVLGVGAVSYERDTPIDADSDDAMRQLAGWWALAEQQRETAYQAE